MDTVAVLNEEGRVIYSARVPPKTREIEVAGDVARDGAPVNVKICKVSRDVRNLSIAADSFACDELKQNEHAGRVFYSRHSVAPQA